MRTRQILRQWYRSLALSPLLIAGCDSTDPFTSGQGHASVLISVENAAGQPLPGASVRISCSNGGPTVHLQTDSTGRIGANINSRTEAFSGQGIRLPCQIAEPGQGPARAAIDTAIGFARGPVLVPLQTFDLREP